MALVLTSTSNETLEDMQRALGDDWRTPAKKRDEVRTGETPDQLPPKEFSQFREQQIAEKKEAEEEFRDQAHDRDYRRKGSGHTKHSRHIDRATKDWKTAESRALAAEQRAADLESQLHGGRAPAESLPAESPSETETEPQEDRTPQETQPATQKPVTYIAGAEKYPDFSVAMAEADRNGLKVSQRAKTAILSMRNSADIIYFLARNPEECQQLLAESDSATDKVGQLSRYLMENPAQATQAGRLQQPQLDQTSIRRDQLLGEHLERMQKLRAADIQAAKAIDAAIRSGLDISLPAYDAILEQPNSEQVLRYLVMDEPEQLTKLNELPPAAAISRVGRIAERLESKAKRQPVRPPDPLSPVGTSATRTGMSLDEMDIHSFIRARKRQEREHKRMGR